MNWAWRPHVSPFLSSLFLNPVELVTTRAAMEQSFNDPCFIWPCVLQCFTLSHWSTGGRNAMEIQKKIDLVKCFMRKERHSKKKNPNGSFKPDTVDGKWGLKPVSLFLRNRLWFFQHKFLVQDKRSGVVVFRQLSTDITSNSTEGSTGSNTMKARTWTTSHLIPELHL